MHRKRAHTRAHTSLINWRSLRVKVDGAAAVKEEPEQRDLMETEEGGRGGLASQWIWLIPRYRESTATPNGHARPQPMARRLHAGSRPRPHAWAHAQEHGHAQSVTLPPPRNLSDNRCLSVCLFVSKITEKVIKIYNEILTGQGINGYILVTFWKPEGLWSLSNLQYYVTLYYYSTYYLMYISIISIKIRMNKYAWIMCEWIKWQIRWYICIKNIILFAAILCFINVYILWVWRGNTLPSSHTVKSSMQQEGSDYGKITLMAFPSEAVLNSDRLQHNAAAPETCIQFKNNGILFFCWIYVCSYTYECINTTTAHVKSQPCVTF